MHSRSFSFRLSAKNLDTLKLLQNSEESLNKTAQRLLLQALKNEISTESPQIEHIVKTRLDQELKPILERLKSLEMQTQTQKPSPRLTEEDLSRLRNLAASIR